VSICRFCGQKFSNGQAVRAHLKGCAEYRARPRGRQLEAGPLGSPSLGSDSLKALPDATPEADAPFDPVRQLGQQLQAERIRLQLREVEEAHAELDRRAQSKTREREIEVRSRRDAESKAQTERADEARRRGEAERERANREAAELDRRERRRTAIQKVKRQVLDWWWADVATRTELKSRVLGEIEKGLAPLPVEDLPHAELVAIAEGIRDRHYREAKATEQAAQRSAIRRRDLVAFGKDYLAGELREVEGLDVLDQWRIEKRVERDLEAVAGTETREDIEDQVDAILEDEGIGWDEDDE
jgi:hypothetical protein